MVKKKEKNQFGILSLVWRSLCLYSITCVKWPIKIDNTKNLMTTGSLLKVESIAECFPWSILQYFLPALSDNWS